MPERRKINTSFHDLSPREYMYFPKGVSEMSSPGQFSRTELLHLTIAMIVLTLAFSFTFSPVYQFNVSVFLGSLPISFLGIVSAFFVHELSHKFMAQKYGLWSEFRMYPQGLLLSLVIAMFTRIVFAAPGAVMFQGESRRFEIGRIAAAGPCANIVTAAVSFPLAFVLFDVYVGSVNLGTVTIFVSFINSLLATFNLLPFGPLDGVKVIRWNGVVWSFLFTAAIILLLLNFNRGLMLPGF